MKVVVTGASGHFAQALIPQLIRDGRISEIVGVDLRPPDNPFPGVTYHQLDVRSRQLLSVLDEADVLFHLAFVIFHRGQRRRAEEVNLDGSIQAFEMAARRGVKRIVMASSHTVYGAHPDNPIPIDEGWPLRGNRSLHYAWAKRLIEEYLYSFESRNPDVSVIRMRPCTVWGPHVPLSRANLFLSSISLAARKYNAPIQLLHEADVARAFLAAGTAPPEVSGAFNVAPADWVRPSDLRKFLRVRALELPAPAVRLVNSVMWRLNLTEISPQWLLLARHPIVLDSQKARDHLAWKSFRDTVDIARETVALIRGEIPVG